MLEKWKECFLVNKYDIGKTGRPYNIKFLTGKLLKGCVPLRSLAVVAVMHEEVKKMQQADLIELSVSLCAAPMVVELNLDGALMVCIEFWMVNKGIVNNAYPMHRIKEKLDVMAGSAAPKTLDMTKG